MSIPIPKEIMFANQHPSALDFTSAIEPPSEASTPVSRADAHGAVCALGGGADAADGDMDSVAAVEPPSEDTSPTARADAHGAACALGGGTDAGKGMLPM